MISFIITIIVSVIVFFGAYMLLNRYVFPNIRVNKWIIFAIALILILLAFALPNTNEVMNYLKIALTGIGAIVFFWFYDINQNGQPTARKKEKQVTIKAKAKPNRVKNKNK
ncbi:MAG: hypothetical protein ACRCYE_15945 [Sarcina sp.]